MSATNFDGDENGGEGYFASVSDLMVGILFVFLLMLTVFALNFHTEEDNQRVAKEKYDALLQLAARQKLDAELKQHEAEIKQAKLKTLLEQAVEQLQSDVKQRQQQRKEMLMSLKGELERALSVPIEVDLETGILHLPGDLLFEKDKFELDEKQKSKVIQIANILGKTLLCYSSGIEKSGCANPPILDTVLVEGHSDKQHYPNVSPETSQERNDRLSTERALAVFKLLRQRPSLLDNLKSTDGQPLFAVSAYGERRPLKDATDDKEAAYRRNRRIDLRFVLAPIQLSKEFIDLKAQIDAELKAQWRIRAMP